MARGDAPAFLFYFDKWRGSRAVQRMTFAERGMYLEMMIEQVTKGSLPDDADQVADLIATTEAQIAEVKASWPTLRRKFTTHQTSPERIINVQLAKILRERRAWLRKQEVSGKKGGEQSARKRRGINLLNPIGSLAKPAPDRTEPAPDSTSGSSGSSGSSGEREKSASVSPPTDPTRDPFTDPVITERAGRFIERYEGLYQTHRHGALYSVKPHRDYQAAVTLCRTWTDDTRLDKLAVIFLTTNHKFAEEGSRTIPQFLALASWCDGRLAEHEAKKAVGA